MNFVTITWLRDKEYRAQQIWDWDAALQRFRLVKDRSATRSVP